MSDIKFKRTEPTVPVTHPNFTYQRGADVQATWRRFGWVPPSESRPAPVIQERLEKYDWDQPARRVK